MLIPAAGSDGPKVHLSTAKVIIYLEYQTMDIKDFERSLASKLKKVQEWVQGEDTLRFRVNRDFLTDFLYCNAVAAISQLGGTVIEFDPVTVNFDGFGTLLSADMKIDLPEYLR